MVYKRPTDLKIKEDVPVCCNVLIANIFDEGKDELHFVML